jgi:hypothetical protein
MAKDENDLVGLSLNASKGFSILIYEFQISWERDRKGIIFFRPFLTGVSKGPFSGGLKKELLK